ncbi:MAG: ABC transporter permease [Ruminococcaceae bacterium]|nr:ABC transporter permease [Oscillospiraceae bacterium]
MDKVSFTEKSKGSLKNLKKYKNLLVELVRKNIKLQYRGSILGLFWTCLQPLLTMVVLSFVFSMIFGKNSVANYPVYLLTGRLLFDFYSGSTKKAMRSIRGNASIIKKVYVPKYAYPFSNIVSTFITFAISLIDLVVVIAFFNIFIPGKAIYITPCVLLAIIPIIVLAVLSTGVGFILATLQVFFRDVEYLYDVFCLLLFYMTPIVYTVDKLKLGAAAIVLKANPLYGIITAFRACVTGQTGLAGQKGLEATYGPGHLTKMFHLAINTMTSWTFVYAVIFAFAALGIGILVFKKKQDKFILHI